MILPTETPPIASLHSWLADQPSSYLREPVGEVLSIIVRCTDKRAENRPTASELVSQLLDQAQWPDNLLSSTDALRPYIAAHSHGLKTKVSEGRSESKRFKTATPEGKSPTGGDLRALAIPQDVSTASTAHVLKANISSGNANYQYGFAIAAATASNRTNEQEPHDLRLLAAVVPSK